MSSSSAKTASALRESLMEKGLGGHSVDTIASYLEEAELPYGYEGDVKRHIRRVLDQAGIPYEVNARIGSRTRVSFLVAGCIALCCYVDASAPSIHAQLEKFARSSAVDGVILVTSRDVNLASGYVAGKPAAVVKPSRSWV